MKVVNYKDGNFDNTSLENMEFIPLEEFLEKNGFEDKGYNCVVVSNDENVDINIESDGILKEYILNNDMELSKNLYELLEKDFNLKEKTDDEPEVKIKSTDEFPLVIRISKDGYTIDYLDEDKYSEDYLNWCLEDFNKHYEEFKNKVELRCTVSQKDEICTGCLYGFMECFPTATINTHITKIPFDDSLVSFTEFLIETDKENTTLLKDFLDWMIFKYGMNFDLQINGHSVSVEEVLLKKVPKEVKNRQQSYPVWFIDGEPSLAL